ncbi:MAG: hypothetical protein NTU79_02575, partial [Planctomycetota bacterium]|nr:hypothetical protein [Planctomycetota bacterium]
LFFLGFGVGNFVTFLRATAEQDHGSESPDFIRMAPTPNPGLTWILSSGPAPGTNARLFLWSPSADMGTYDADCTSASGRSNDGWQHPV